MGAALIRTDMTKLIGVFDYFCEFVTLYKLVHQNVQEYRMQNYANSPKMTKEKICYIFYLQCKQLVLSGCRRVCGESRGVAGRIWNAAETIIRSNASPLYIPSVDALRKPILLWTVFFNGKPDSSPLAVIFTVLRTIWFYCCYIVLLTNFSQLSVKRKI